MATLFPTSRPDVNVAKDVVVGLLTAFLALHTSASEQP